MCRVYVFRPPPAALLDAVVRDLVANVAVADPPRVPALAHTIADPSDGMSSPSPCVWSASLRQAGGQSRAPRGLQGGPFRPRYITPAIRCEMWRVNPLERSTTEMGPRVRRDRPHQAAAICFVAPVLRGWKGGSITSGHIMSIIFVMNKRIAPSEVDVLERQDTKLAPSSVVTPPDRRGPGDRDPQPHRTGSNTPRSVGIEPASETCSDRRERIASVVRADRIALELRAA